MRSSSREKKFKNDEEIQLTSWDNDRIKQFLRVLNKVLDFETEEDSYLGFEINRNLLDDDNDHCDDDIVTDKLI